MSFELLNIELGRYGFYGFKILNIDTSKFMRSLFGVQYGFDSIFIEILFFTIRFEL